MDGQSLGADVKPGEPCDASASEPSSCARKEGQLEAQGSNQFHEQAKLGPPTLACSISDSKLQVMSSFSGEDKGVHYADERTVGSRTPAVSEAASGSAKAEQDNELSTCSSSEVAEENRDVKKDSNSALLTEQKPSVVAGIHSESKEGKSEDAALCSGSGNTLHVESKGENTDDIKAADLSEQTEKEMRDISVPVLENSCVACWKLRDRKDSFGHCSDRPVPRVESPSIPEKENQQHDKYSWSKSEAIESGGMEEGQVSCVNASGSQPEFVKAGDPGTSSSFHFPCPLPFQISSMSGSFPASVTVVAPAKGSFFPPENPMRSKGELGWKGSAATSAFRPAEPRKNLETSLSATDTPIGDTASSKQVRTPLDFDLNVPDQRVYEEVVSQNSAHVMGSKSGSRDRGAGGLDLDLNRVDESPDIGSLSASSSCRLEMHPLASKSSLSVGLSNGGVNDSRDFDLNNGPGLDEVATDTAPCTQHLKSNVSLRTPVSGLRINSPILGISQHGSLQETHILPSQFLRFFLAGVSRVMVLQLGHREFCVLPQLTHHLVLKYTGASAFVRNCSAISTCYYISISRVSF
ncbi:hypothetical protein GBA52_025201 [Prunus armeniaca]|nr:hypothetical protein GBA52_025201 [Prunus armeniaca]